MWERGRATQGQSRLLKALTSRQKLYVLEEKGPFFIFLYNFHVHVVC